MLGEARTMADAPDSCQLVSACIADIRARLSKAYYSTTNMPTAVMLTRVTRYQLRGVSLYRRIRRLWTSSWLMMFSIWESLLSRRNLPPPFEVEEHLLP